MLFLDLAPIFLCFFCRVSTARGARITSMWCSFLGFGLDYYRGLFSLVLSLFLYFCVIFDVVIGSKGVVGLGSVWEVRLFDFSVG